MFMSLSRFAVLGLFLFSASPVALASIHDKRAFGLQSAHRRRATADFAAASSIDVKTIYNAAKGGAGKNVLASFLATTDNSKKTTINGDWKNLPGVSAYHFMADMDVDCDGVDFQCSGNPDGQSETSFGKLDASKVPFYVLPEQFTNKHKDIKPNALGAIICNNKMFYGIFGDENGDNPQLIGEASILMAKTCFPDDHLSGDNGHTPLDVLYIVFPDQVPSGVGEKTIDIGALKKLGDKQASLLADALGGKDKPAPSPSSTHKSPASTHKPNNFNEQPTTTDDSKKTTNSTSKQDDAPKCKSRSRRRRSLA